MNRICNVLTGELGMRPGHRVLLRSANNPMMVATYLAGRAGVKLDLERFDDIARNTPVLANIRPAGQKYLMEDFYYAGGLRALLNEIRDLLSLDCLTVNGKTLGENIEGAKIYNTDVIRPRANALARDGGLAVLRGNLAPDGAVIKPLAAEAHLLKHTGRAVVFKNYNDMAARIEQLWSRSLRCINVGRSLERAVQVARSEARAGAHKGLAV